MNDILIAISIGLFLSNLYCVYLLRQKSKEEKPILTKDANQLLAELMSGGAVITVQVVNPAEVFMYSPKDIGK